jgi:NAD(P)-dependent dehydrogenase (short-subunit alcohol dehydrogenase family)
LSPEELAASVSPRHISSWSVGHRLVIGARRSESLASAVEVLNGGDRVATVATDVTTIDGCQAAAGAALAAFGAIDVLFTNAGVYGTDAVEDMSEELWDSISAAVQSRRT